MMEFLPYFIYLLLGGDLSSRYELCRNISNKKGLCIPEWACRENSHLGICGETESKTVCCYVKTLEIPSADNEINLFSAPNQPEKETLVEYETSNTQHESKSNNAMYKHLKYSSEMDESFSTENTSSRSWNPFTVPQVYRQPVKIDKTHDMRRPVEVAHDFNLRTPVLSEDSHDLRWPVLEEDTHSDRDSVSRYFTSLDIKLDSVTEKISVNFNANTEQLKPETLLRKYGFNMDNFFSDDYQTVAGIVGCLKQAEDGNPLAGSVSSVNEAVCGLNQINPVARLIGGKNSRYLQWPWMVSLEQRMGYKFYHKCGATLLNNLWVITAAHCVQWQLPYSIRLCLGNYDLKRDVELHSKVLRSVKGIFIHPEFNPMTYENDIALLLMDTPVEFQPNIIPICLPKNMENIEGRTGVVIGWGKVTEKGTLSSTLQEIHLPILSNHQCEEMYAKTGQTEKIPDSFLCAGTKEGGFDACDGDSGGPMTILDYEGRWTLVGLVSWGKECAGANQPGVYTRVSNFIAWIENIMSCFK